MTKAVGGSARCVSPSEARGLVWGVAVGVDLTRRDLQDDAKALRRPWDLAKGFDWSAPLSAILRTENGNYPDKGEISLIVDREVRQRGDLAQQIWQPAEIVATLSEYVELLPGDLIMTGTPSGVGPLAPGAHVSARIAGVGSLEFVVSAAEPDTAI